MFRSVKKVRKEGSDCGLSHQALELGLSCELGTCIERV